MTFLNNSGIRKHIFLIFFGLLILISAFGINLAGIKVTRFILSEGRSESDIDGIDGISFFCDALPYLGLGGLALVCLFIKLLLSVFAFKQYRVAALEGSFIVVWFLLVFGGGHLSWKLCRYIENRPIDIEQQRLNEHQEYLQILKREYPDPSELRMRNSFDKLKQEFEMAVQKAKSSPSPAK